MKKICISLFVLFLLIISITPAFADKERYKIKEKNGMYGLYDTNKKSFVIPIIYNCIRETGNKNIYIVSNVVHGLGYKSSNYGLYDIRKKELIVPLKYFYIKDIERNGCGSDLMENIFYLEDIDDSNSGYYDINENKIIIPKKANITIVNDTSLKNIYIIKQNKKSNESTGENYGLFDAKTQEIILPMEYSFVESLYKNLPILKIETKDKKIGLYDIETKKIVVPIKKQNIKYLPIRNKIKDVYVVIYDKTKAYVYNVEKKQQVTPELAEILTKKCIEYSNDARIDDIEVIKDSEYVINNRGLYFSKDKYLIFDSLKYDGEYLIVEKNKKFGLYNENGNEILPIEYQYIQYRYDNDENGNYIPIDDKIIFVKNNNLKGIFELKTKTFILPIEYNDFFPIQREKGTYYVYKENREDKMVIIKNNKIGLFDLKNKKLVTKPIFDKIEGLSKNDDVFIVKINDKYGLYDIETKNYILEPKYYGIEKTDNDNLFILISENGKSLIDIKSNKILIPEGFVSIHSTGNDKLYIVEKNNKWGLYNTATQKLILPTKYDELSVLYHKNGEEQSKTMRMFDVEKPLKIKFDTDKMKVISK